MTSTHAPTTSVSNSIKGEKVAILVANGFREEDLVDSQRMLQELGAFVRIVAMDPGLVNSWDGQAWGLNFAVDHVLNTSLAADFSMLIVPGGQRSAAKLKLTSHSKRFVGGFLDYGKPVVVFDNAFELLLHSERLNGYTVSAPEEFESDARGSGAICSQSDVCRDRNLLTGCRVNNDNSHILSEMRTWFGGSDESGYSQAA